MSYDLVCKMQQMKKGPHRAGAPFDPLPRPLAPTGPVYFNIWLAKGAKVGSLGASVGLGTLRSEHNGSATTFPNLITILWCGERGGATTVF